MTKPPPPAPETLPASAPAAIAVAIASSMGPVEMPLAMSRLLSQPWCRVAATARRSPRSSASFIATAAALRRCIASMGLASPAAAWRTCSAMIVALSRLTPVKQRTVAASSSRTISGLIRSGLTTTTSSARNSMKLKPPKAAAY